MLTAARRGGGCRGKGRLAGRGCPGVWCEVLEAGHVGAVAADDLLARE